MITLTINSLNTNYKLAAVAASSLVSAIVNQQSLDIEIADDNINRKIRIYSFGYDFSKSNLDTLRIIESTNSRDYNCGLLAEKFVKGNDINKELFDMVRDNFYLAINNKRPHYDITVKTDDNMFGYISIRI